MLGKAYSRKFTVDFNFNSNHIEGNTITCGQTELLTHILPSAEIILYLRIWLDFHQTITCRKQERKAF